MAFYTQQSSDSEASYVMHTKLHTHKNVANLIKCSIRVFFSSYRSFSSTQKLLGPINKVFLSAIINEAIFLIPYSRSA